MLFLSLSSKKKINEIDLDSSLEKIKIANNISSIGNGTPMMTETKQNAGQMEKKTIVVL